MNWTYLGAWIHNLTSVLLLVVQNNEWCDDKWKLENVYKQISSDDLAWYANDKMVTKEY